MVRKTLIAALAAGALIATPVIASAATAGTTAGTPTMATAGFARTFVQDPGGSSSTTTSSVPAPSAGSPAAGDGTTAGPDAKHPKLRWLRRHHARLAGAVHAQWTTKTKDGSYVTHDAIRGTVGIVSTGSTSITVTAADHTTQTYSTSSTTKVWKVVEENGKRHIEKATLSDVAKDATVIVEGTGATGPFAATRILVQLPK